LSADNRNIASGVTEDGKLSHFFGSDGACLLQDRVMFEKSVSKWHVARLSTTAVAQKPIFSTALIEAVCSHHSSLGS
jgi:hypothetical protein